MFIIKYCKQCSLKSTIRWAAIVNILRKIFKWPKEALSLSSMCSMNYTHIQLKTKTPQHNATHRLLYIQYHQCRSRAVSLAGLEHAVLCHGNLCHNDHTCHNKQTLTTYQSQVINNKHRQPILLVSSETAKMALSFYSPQWQRFYNFFIDDITYRPTSVKLLSVIHSCTQQESELQTYGIKNAAGWRYRNSNWAWEWAGTLVHSTFSRGSTIVITDHWCWCCFFLFKYRLLYTLQLDQFTSE